MKRYLFSLFILCLFGCPTPPAEPTPPFIHVTVVPPAVGVPPVASDFTILVEAIVEGNLIQKVIETPTGDLPLPLDFVILFSEEIRGQAIDISVTGFANGVDVFSGVASGIANADDIILVAGFCGDTEINDARNETCDDGPDNSDTAPGACRLSCLLAGCGDGIVDPGEDCDEGDLINEDGCSNVCLNEICGDGIVQSSFGELCDNGQNNSDTTPDACRTNCQPSFCGDGVPDQDEECDDANNIADDGCELGCFATVIQVVTGNSHTCFLTRSGKVKCWGLSSSGQLGYGNIFTIGDNETPSSIGFVNIGGFVSQLSAGSGHTCALLDTGNVRCWGQGAGGKLGYGNSNNIGDDETPASAGNVNVGGAVTQIAAGDVHTCALLTTGSLRCWGVGNNGQLGYGNTNNIGDNETPASAGNVNVGGLVADMSLGNSHTCALLTTGNVRCWGFGANGRLGYGNIDDIGDDETPASAGNVNIGSIVDQLSVGGGHSCALLDTGNVRCWGVGSLGRLGYGNSDDIGDTEIPASAGNVSVGGLVAEVSTGSDYTCSLLSTGDVRCWGAGNFGRLGYGNLDNIGDNELPSSLGNVNVGGVVVQLSESAFHTCALLRVGTIRCWGAGNLGRLGYGNTNNIGDDEVPADVGDVPLF
jgi:cysteine-rich repeat protein